MSARISFKLGVVADQIGMEIWHAMTVATGIWYALGAINGLVVTALRNGAHRPGSKHFMGLAVDLRTHNLPAEKRRIAVALLGAQLGDTYDVLFENEGTPDEHCHCEYDP